LFAAGCLIGVVVRPIYGLVTYVAVYYLHPPSRWWGETLPELRWSFVAALVTAIGVFLRGRRKEILPLRRQGFFLGYLAFLLWIYIQ
jgi:hypothetical protein